MTEPNKQEFVSASKDANKQPTAEAGAMHTAASPQSKQIAGQQISQAVGLIDAVAWLVIAKDSEGKVLIRAPFLNENAARGLMQAAVNQGGYRASDVSIQQLYTSQTTATQAAVAAAMRKAEEVCEEQHMSWADDVWNHACNTCRNAIKKLTPAEANAALDAYVQEKCMEVAQAVMDYYLLEDGKGELHQEPIPTIVRDVLNKNREG
jgi:hypothetical protein